MAKTNKEIQDRIIQMYNDPKQTCKSIAKTVGVMESTVSRILKNAGIQIIDKQTLTPDYLPEAIQLYNNGESCKKIADKFGVTTTTISKWLKKSGIDVVNRQNQLNWTIEEVIEAYNNGESLSSMAKRLHTTQAALSRHLKKAGINVVNKWNETKFNETVFDCIDSEEKAYWLGFIYADGYIGHNEGEKNRNRFEISLAIEDIEHLHKFNKFMEYDGDNVTTKISVLNGVEFGVCRWTITNKHLWNTLNNIGCTPRKSKTLVFPSEHIFKDKSLIRHFIRGYFDGDGCISFADQDHSKPCINILGTKSMLDKIREITIGDNLNHQIANSDTDNIDTLCMNRSGTKAMELMYILYYKANVYLERKYQRFLYFKDCRFKAKALKLLEGKIGEGWDANPELIADLNDLQQCNA